MIRPVPPEPIRLGGPIHGPSFDAPHEPMHITKVYGWSGEEVAEGIERWLKTRRDECMTGGVYGGAEIDVLLDEARDAFAQGWMPWQRLNDDPSISSD